MLRTHLGRLTLVVVLLLAMAMPQAVAGEAGRVAGNVADDPVAAAIEVSRSSFVLDGSAHSVVLGRADNFADNLGGAALAGVAGGPLLLTASAELDAATRAEIDRVIGQPAGDCSRGFEVYMLGGTVALSAEVEKELRSAGYCADRLFGQTRVETAIRVAGAVDAMTAELGLRQTRDYLLARDDNAIDSAAGGALGARYGMPILVTQTGELHPAVQSFLFPTDDNPSADNVTILGGTAAINQQVEDQLNDAGDATVTRHAGLSREHTAALIARDFYDRQDPEFGADTAAIVNGFQTDSWVLALTAGAIASRTQGPVMYVQTAAVTQATTDVLFEYTPVHVTGYGPTDLISEQTLQDAARAAEGPADQTSRMGRRVSGAP